MKWLTRGVRTSLINICLDATKNRFAFEITKNSLKRSHGKRVHPEKMFENAAHSGGARLLILQLLDTASFRKTLKLNFGYRSFANAVFVELQMFFLLPVLHLWKTVPNFDGFAIISRDGKNIEMIRTILQKFSWLCGSVLDPFLATEAIASDCFPESIKKEITANQLKPKRERWYLPLKTG